MKSQNVGFWGGEGGEGEGKCKIQAHLSFHFPNHQIQKI